MSEKIMRFSLVVMLFVPLFAFAQERAERPGLGKGAPHIFLRNARAAAETEHDAIWSVEPRQARERYRSLGPDMRSDVWTIHFERFLNDHPELTPMQRTVVIDALELVEGGFIEASFAYQNNPDLWLANHVQAERLERRAIAAFGLDRERQLLELPGRPETANAQPSAPKTVVIDSGNCNCQGDGDCSTGETCVPRFQSHCTFVIECGPLADQTCTGLCTQV